MRALLSVPAGLCLIAWFAVATACPVSAAESQGITVPQLLPAYDPAAAACTAPSGLNKSLGFAQDNDRAFIEGVGFGLAAAAEDRGLSYSARVANNDATTQAADVDAFRAAKTGAVITAPVDASSLAPHVQQVMWDGGYVG